MIAGHDHTDTEPQRMALIAINYSALRALLMLPEGARIAQAHINPVICDQILLHIHGAGWTCGEGRALTQATCTITDKVSKTGKLLRRTLTYNFPD